MATATAKASRSKSSASLASSGAASSEPQGKTLVIVESPAKAKTIGQFLGDQYVVEASFGHVRDLPNNAAEIPEEVKKEKWSRLGVNPDASFEPLYIVPEDKKRHVSRLKSALKDVNTVLLATDEDREGESISWHLLQVLKPNQKINVKRIVFHEITREAITEAIRNPRTLDEALVRAQESRRILDRLYGYTLSPLLWKKVAPKLSAGRVQSVATRLIVLRERQRQAFHTATWWDLAADLSTSSGKFRSTLVRKGTSRLATGRSFDSTTGELKEGSHLLLDEAGARALERTLTNATPWKVLKLEQTPGTEKPVPPFTTSTLQQEANRKLRFTSKKTMQLAQALYEGIELGGGERVGLITYMRTDSLTLSDKALTEAREVIADLYGADYLPPAPIRYRTTTKNAQEAHEAIRPSDLTRRPQDVRPFLDDEQYKLYEMIWKRTIACQMVPARVQRTTVEVGILDLVFVASGKQILFPGFLRAYVEGSDDPDADLGDKESLLPLMQEGQTLNALSVTALSHTTRPPARYTEASLVQTLEEGGIGRPSTYATIMSTIQDRGYCFKRGNELIPTFTAYCVTEFLEKHFPDLVDVGFTSQMEDQLDEISTGARDAVGYLHSFYTGDTDHTGLIVRVEQEQQRLEFPRIAVGRTPETDEPVVVKMGRFGPYLQRGEGGAGNFASIPEELPPADLTLEMALELLNRRAAGPDVIATDPVSGGDITLHKGRFGEYLELNTGNEESSDKKRRVSLPRGLTVADVTPEIAIQLMSLPRVIGKHPETGLELSTNIGRFGPYVKHGEEFRSLKTWQEACTISLPDALALLAQPKVGRGRTAGALPVLRELGPAEGAAGPIKVIDGRYGPYISDGETNAPLPKDKTPDELTVEEALAALESRRSSNPKAGKKGKAGSTKKGTKKATESGATGDESGESPDEAGEVSPRSTLKSTAVSKGKKGASTPASSAGDAGSAEAPSKRSAARDTSAGPAASSKGTASKKSASAATRDTSPGSPSDSSSSASIAPAPTANAPKSGVTAKAPQKKGASVPPKTGEKKVVVKKQAAKPPPPKFPPLIMVTAKSLAAEAAAKEAAEREAARPSTDSTGSASRGTLVKKK